MCKKMMIPLIVVFVILSFLPSGVIAEDLYENSAVEIVKSVSFRTGPSTGAARIRYLQVGERLHIISEPNHYWLQVKDAAGKTGYVSSLSTYVKRITLTAYPEANGQVIASVSFRTGSSTSASRIRYLQAGEPLWILDKPSDYWYKAQDKQGVIGYVSAGSGYVTTTYVETWKQLDPAAAAEKAVQAGLGYIGTPYEFGSSRLDTSTFDCSDFVRQAYLDGIGLRLPGDSAQQGQFIREQQEGQVTMDWHLLNRGDLMFFMVYKGYNVSDYEGIDKSVEPINHVGIYLGDGQVLHTYSIASGGVKISDIAGTLWERRYLFGGSVYR